MIYYLGLQKTFENLIFWKIWKKKLAANIKETLRQSSKTTSIVLDQLLESRGQKPGK